jgi:hypothetical protein
LDGRDQVGGRLADEALGEVLVARASPPIVCEKVVDALVQEFLPSLRQILLDGRRSGLAAADVEVDDAQRGSLSILSGPILAWKSRPSLGLGRIVTLNA